MVIQHKNSGYQYIINDPRYIEIDGIYGYLVVLNQVIYFFYSTETGIDYEIVTEKFLLIN